MSNYEILIEDNLKKAFSAGADCLAATLPARKTGDDLLELRAFGETCTIVPGAVLFGGTPETGPRGLVVALYAANAREDALLPEPFLSFRDFPDSMPYQGAFVSNTERPLVPHVTRIQKARETVLEALGGQMPPAHTPGDFSLQLYPLPKIALSYIFYLPDEEFPASVTCLFSNNARSFMPLDGLADTAEYTTKKIQELL